MIRLPVIPLVLGVVFLIGLSSGQAYDLGPEQNLGVSGESLDMAIDGDGDLHLSYIRGGAVWYLRQVNGNWRSEMQVPGSSGTYFYRWRPNIAVDSAGNAHFCWANASMTSIYYNAYINGSWYGLTTAIGDTGGADTNRNDLTVDRNGNAIVVAQSDFAIQANIKVIGGGFTGEQTLYYNTSEPKNPSVAASPIDNKVYCFYAKNNANPPAGLMYNIYNGSSWGGATRPGSNGGPCCANNSTTFIDNHGKPHMAWVIWKSGTEYSDLLYMYQKPNNDWSSVKTLVSQSHYFNCYWDECPFPQVATDNADNTVIAYANSGSSSLVHIFVKEADGNWPASPDRITMSSNYQDYPALVCDGYTFSLAWRDSRNGNAIYYRTISFDSLPPLLNAPTMQSAAVNNNKVYITWSAPSPSDTLSHYRLQRKMNFDSWTDLTTTTKTFWIDETISPGNGYTYRVCAVDVYDRDSAFSNEANLYIDVPAVSSIAIFMMILMLSALFTVFRKKNLSVKN